MIAATDMATKLGLLAACVLLLGIVIEASRRSSRASGWGDLARKYAGSGKLAGRRFAVPCLVTGSMAHFGGAFVRVGEESLQFSMSGPFALFHPRLTIPWSQIDGIVRHPDTPDLPGISFTDFGLAYYFDGAAFEAVQEAWRNHRERTLTASNDRD